MRQKDVLTPDAPDIVAEACAWLAQIETGRLSEKDLAALREWIQRSPRHYAELRRLAQLSHEVNILTEMSEPMREISQRRRGVLLGRDNTSRRPAVWGLPAFGAVAAAAIALGFVLLAAPALAPAPSGSDPLMVATAIGQVEAVLLADGSTMKLNTDSQVSVNFGATERRILLEKGEAFFEVKHDPARPFVVYAGDKSVTAVGTAFSVRWTDSDLMVTVSEGRVAYGEVLTPPRAEGTAETGVSAALTGSQPTVVEAGQRLAVSSADIQEVVETVSSASISREMAWQSGFLDFEDAPLREVVREMQRYTPKTIVIADEELADIQFGGVFRIGETNAFFDALELSFGVEVIEVDDTLLLLKAAGG